MIRACEAEATCAHPYTIIWKYDLSGQVHFSSHKTVHNFLIRRKPSDYDLYKQVHQLCLHIWNFLLPKIPLLHFDARNSFFADCKVGINGFAKRKGEKTHESYRLTIIINLNITAYFLL